MTNPTPAPDPFVEQLKTERDDLIRQYMRDTQFYSPTREREDAYRFAVADLNAQIAEYDPAPFDLGAREHAIHREVEDDYREGAICACGGSKPEGAQLCRDCATADDFDDR